jgi:hypothetical protein
VNNSIVFLVITTSVQHHGDIRMNTTVDRLYKYTVKIHIILLFPNSCLITGIVTRLTRRMPVVEKELLTLPEHLSSPPVFNGVHVTRSLVLCVCFVDLFVLLSFFFWPLCYICSSGPSRASEQSYIYVLGVSFLPLSTILIFDFGMDSTMWQFLFFILLLRRA